MCSVWRRRVKEHSTMGADVYISIPEGDVICSGAGTQLRRRLHTLTSLHLQHWPYTTADNSTTTPAHTASRKAKQFHLIFFKKKDYIRSHFLFE